jgi:hypothetical protein
MPTDQKAALAPRRKKQGVRRSAGRPSAFRADFVEQARKLCALGATDFELGEFFKVDTSTIYRWKNTNAKFCEAVKVGKEKADDRVERSLFNRAVGYSFESEKVFQFQGQIVRAKTVEHVPPDPGAAFNWLKNRRGDVWRDKQQHELSGSLEFGLGDKLERALARVAEV